MYKYIILHNWLDKNSVEFVNSEANNKDAFVIDWYRDPLSVRNYTGPSPSAFPTVVINTIDGFGHSIRCPQSILEAEQKYANGEIECSKEYTLPVNENGQPIADIEGFFLAIVLDPLFSDRDVLQVQAVKEILDPIKRNTYILQLIAATDLAKQIKLIDLATQYGVKLPLP